MVDEMDTLTRVWSISSGTYSSRFGSVGTSAVALTARKLKAKLVDYAAHLMELPGGLARIPRRRRAAEERQGRVVLDQGPGRTGPLEHRRRLPEGMEPGLQATAVFGFTVAQPWTTRTA